MNISVQSRGMLKYPGFPYMYRQINSYSTDLRGYRRLNSPPTFFYHDVYSKLGGGASWALFDGASWAALFKWEKIKSFENECNELTMIGIGILCIFHSFPLKKCIREDFFVDFFDFQKNTCLSQALQIKFLLIFSSWCYELLPMFSNSVSKRPRQQSSTLLLPSDYSSS